MYLANTVILPCSMLPGIWLILVEFAKCYTFSISSKRLWFPVWLSRDSGLCILGFLPCCTAGRHFIKSPIVQIQKIYSGSEHVNWMFLKYEKDVFQPSKLIIHYLKLLIHYLKLLMLWKITLLLFGRVLTPIGFTQNFSRSMLVKFHLHA